MKLSGKYIMQAILQTLSLLFQPGSELRQIIGVTLYMAFFSTVISSCLGLPIGVLIGSRGFWGKGLVMRILNTLMGLPPVVAGLLVFFLLSRSGPLGQFRLLYSVSAMVTAQVLLITPVVAGISASIVSDRAPRLRETAIGMGMGKWDELICLLYDCRTQLLSAVFIGFGRSIAEVGAVSIVGGNVQYKTRVMTTAIMLETNKGNFELAVALGALLLTISFIINALALSMQERKTESSERRHKNGFNR